MKKLYKIIILFVLFLIILGAYFHTTHLPLPKKIRNYQDIMKKISSQNESLRVKAYVQNDPLSFTFASPQEYYTLNWWGLLEYLHAKLNYTKEEIMHHEDPIAILDYGKGRSAEFSIAYIALSLAFDYEVRMIMCLTDHLWVELKRLNEWMHIDPTEKIVDDPYMYERDQDKDFNGKDDKVYAIEPEQVTDVTESYRYLPNLFIKTIEYFNISVEFRLIREDPVFYLGFTQFEMFLALAIENNLTVIFLHEEEKKFIFWYWYSVNSTERSFQCRYSIEREE